MTADEILNSVCYGAPYGKPTYFMTPDEEELAICEELVEQGLLLRVDSFAPDFPNSSYTYVSNDEIGKGVIGNTTQYLMGK